MTKNCAIYARAGGISAEKSLMLQIDRCAKLAAMRQDTVAGIYADTDPGQTDDREEFRRMVTERAQRQINIIHVSSRDRLRPSRKNMPPN